VGVEFSSQVIERVKAIANAYSVFPGGDGDIVVNSHATKGRAFRPDGSLIPAGAVAGPTVIVEHAFSQELNDVLKKGMPVYIAILL
jgi:hypothetical protein